MKKVLNLLLLIAAMLFAASEATAQSPADTIEKCGIRSVVVWDSVAYFMSIHMLCGERETFDAYMRGEVSHIAIKIGGACYVSDADYIAALKPTTLNVMSAMCRLVAKDPETYILYRSDLRKWDGEKRVLIFEQYIMPSGN